MSEQVLDELQTKVVEEFDKWAAEIRDAFIHTVHDKISERDVIDRKLIIDYVIRWCIEEYGDLGPERVRFLFECVYCQIAGMHIGGVDFSTEYMPPALRKQFMKGR